MKFKKIGNLERVLISECVKDIPDFGKISKLFEMGADINAVNEFGESVAAIIFEGYCCVKKGVLRTGYFVPLLLDYFIIQGFDLKRHGLLLVSELQNSAFDGYVRAAITALLKKRKALIKNDIKKMCVSFMQRTKNVFDPHVA